MASQIQSALGIPLMHLADATADRIVAQGTRKVGLPGTNFTMEQDFYKGRLSDQHGLNVIVPSAADRQIIQLDVQGE